MGRRGVTWMAVIACLLGAIVIAPATPADAIVNGQRVGEARFAETWSFTVHLSEAAGEGSRSAFCTGVLVDPSWVLTAGHCLSGGLEDGPVPAAGGRLTPLASRDVGISYGSPFWPNGQLEAVAAVVFPPGYEPATGTDLALLELSNPVNPGTIAIPAGLAEQPHEVPGPDDQVAVAGWGLTSLGASMPLQLGEGMRTISSAEGSGLLFTTGMIGLCSGDSGGPMLVPGSPLVVGIASISATSCDGLAGHAPVHPVLDWVDEVVGGLGPVARRDAYQVAAGTTLTVAAGDGVLANDSLYDTLEPGTVASVVDPPEAGRLTFDEADGSFTYIPDPGFRGTDSFGYLLTKGDRQSSAYVELRVTAPPTAVDDEYTWVLDEYAFEIDDAGGIVRATLAVAAPGVLTNDLGSSLSAEVDRSLDVPSDDVQLELTLAPDGGFLLELTLDVDDATEERLNWLIWELGKVDFSYRAFDGIESSNEARVDVVFCPSQEECGDGEPPVVPPTGPTLSVGDVLERLEAPTAVPDERWRLADVHDDVVILHLCAAWCAPCKLLAQQLGQDLQELEDTYGPDSFEVVEVLLEDSVGNPSGASVAAAWAESFTGETISVLHADGSQDSEVWQLAQAIGLQAYPTLVLLDPDRRIVDIRIVGGGEGAFAAAIEDALDAAADDEPDGVHLLQQLRDEVSSELPEKDGTSLTTMVANVERLLTDGDADNDVAVPKLLATFVAKVDAARRRGIIDPDDAERWIATATAIATGLTSEGG